MYKTIITLSLPLIFTGCISSGLSPTSSDDLKYVEVQNINAAVGPKLDTGFAIVKCDKIKTAKNITPEDFMSKAMTNSQYFGSEIVMVSTDISDGYYYFDACYLKEIDIEGMVFGAKLNSDMPMDIREEFDSNKGCALGKVYYETPAYKNDLHENDVVTYANNKEVKSCKHLQEIIYDADMLNLTLWADGNEFEVNGIELNK